MYGYTRYSPSSVPITSAEPRLTLNETDQAVNEKLWDIDVQGKVFSIRTRTDADGAGMSVFTITRGAGTAITEVAIPTNVGGGQVFRVYGTSNQAIEVVPVGDGTAYIRGNTNVSAFYLGQGGVNRWALSATAFVPAADNAYTLGTPTGRPLMVHSMGVTVYNAPSLITSGVALTDYAAAAGGTLTNAPAAGNPTKWIAINDNGTIRKIPTWL